ncbi:hypothetical protein M1O55_01665 [Dehalococcoidia bacterium]|nr:hypothetical protein [Dehalococcoidia bacterium]
MNFPIYSTCQPSKVCSDTCYALSGPITWPNSLNKHKANEQICRNSPSDFAHMVINECKNLLKKDDQFFLRWNGTGDLFEEAVQSLVFVSRELPKMPIWAVTRIPRFGKMLLDEERPNIYVHFSLDKKSMNRREELLSSLGGTKPSNLFFSYQCDSGEDYSFQEFASVVFLDRYKPLTDLPEHEAICPLNLKDDITDTCRSCRRCFNGDAIKHSSETHRYLNGENNVL